MIGSGLLIGRPLCRRRVWRADQNCSGEETAPRVRVVLLATSSDVVARPGKGGKVEHGVRDYSIVGDADASLANLVGQLGHTLEAAGFTLAADASKARIVLNLVDPERPRPFRRKSRGTFVAALWARPDLPEDGLRETYPMLVRALANISLCYVPGTGVLFTTMERGHYLVPERDGILSGLLVAECVAHFGRPLADIVATMEEEFGRLHYDRRDFNRPMDRCARLIERVRAGALDALLGGGVTSREEVDGVKLNFADGSWILFRKSGTEPIIRIYCESPDEGRVQEMLTMAVDELDVAHLGAGPQMRQMWRHRHGLHAAGHSQVVFTRLDRVGSVHDRAHARTADLVERDARNAVGNPCAERRLSGRRLADQRRSPAAGR